MNEIIIRTNKDKKGILYYSLLDRVHTTAHSNIIKQEESLKVPDIERTEKFTFLFKTMVLKVLRILSLKGLNILPFKKIIN